MNIGLIIIALLFTVFVAIKPFKIKGFPINMATGSIVSLILLLLTGVIDQTTIEVGILGNGQLKPWEIILIFFSVAYISISTDITGIFDYLAYKIIHKSKGDGSKLFLFFYLFACLLTVFTSNDIVILTLTPIIFYLGKHAKLNVVPLLFAEFFGANTLSMLLYIGNPTNIIVGNALGLGFFEYTKVMWLPTITAAISNYFLLRIVFNKKITKKFEINSKSTFKVTNWADAILSTFLMLVTLVTLALSQNLGIEIWQVTTVAALVFVTEDLFFTQYNKKTIGRLENEFIICIKRIPWKILPFIFTFFILVQGLVELGIIDLIAQGISQFSTNPINGIVTNGIIGITLANLINNQPMTILMTNVLISKSYIVSEETFKASAYSLIIASNLGANITLIGALAGLMWKKILSNKGVQITYIEFLKNGILITPIVLMISLIALNLSI